MNIISAQRRQLTAALLLICSTLLFTGCADSNAQKVSNTAEPTDKGIVVYSLRDIPEGYTVKSEYLEERELDTRKIPVDALTSASLVVGRTAKYGIASGQIVSQHDIAPQHNGRLISLRLTDAEYELIEGQASKTNLEPEDLVLQWVQDKLEE